MRTNFEDRDILETLHGLNDSQFDALNFGVIAFDPDTTVRRYNLHEAKATGLKPDRVMGHPLFTDVAQCMNNFMVAQKFLDAHSHARPLDETIDFVLTWRMKPTPVQLRLLCAPTTALHYLLLKRVD